MVQWLGIRLPLQGHGFDPFSRKTSHAGGRLSLCTTTIEPVL